MDPPPPPLLNLPPTLTPPSSPASLRSVSLSLSLYENIVWYIALIVNFINLITFCVCELGELCVLAYIFYLHVKEFGFETIVSKKFVGFIFYFWI